jgi:hypothetical protein
MRVTILQGSPHQEKGNTAQALQPFVEGMEAAGAEVSTLLLADRHIEPCHGCFACWKTGQGCVIDDDMPAILDQMCGSDVLVLAAPLYVDHLPGHMKNAIDRSIPLILPEIQVVDDHCRHPQADANWHLRGVVLLSVCGFYECENFAPLVTWAEAYCRNLQAPLLGRLLRPHAHAFSALPRLVPAKASVLRALEQAGQELVAEGRIRPETEDSVSADLLSRDAFIAAANRSWK